jgi:hypothetical protein
MITKKKIDFGVLSNQDSIKLVMQVMHV